MLISSAVRRYPASDKSPQRLPNSVHCTIGRSPNDVMGHFLPKSDVRVMSDHLSIADMRRGAVNRRNRPRRDTGPLFLSALAIWRPWKSRTVVQFEQIMRHRAANHLFECRFSSAIRRPSQPGRTGCNCDQQPLPCTERDQHFSKAAPELLRRLALMRLQC
jgi:hypothetical protein